MSIDVPDYTSYISRIDRGETYPQFSSRYNEKLKIFLAAFFAGAEIPVGATVPLFDFETFMDTPYTSPIGWLADFREWYFSFNGLVRLDTVCMDFPFLTLCSYAAPGEFTHTYEEIIFYDTANWDPYALNTHTWYFAVTNEDTVPLRGAVQVGMVLTDIASSYPETKQVKCRACGHINTVPLKDTRIKCEECGATFFAPYFPGKTI